MSQNGKGSAPRIRTAEERKKFESEYERIFRRAKAKAKKKAR